MSRIGRQPIPVPAGVTVAIEPESVRVNGPKGELVRAHPPRHRGHPGRRAAARHATDRPRRTPRAARPHAHARREHGRRASPTGYEKRLEIQGVGYRAQLKGKNLELAVGYSHPVPIPAPDGHRIRGAPADARRRQGHLQAARRRDRRDHPQAAPARALQGQGHPLRGRVRRSARSASAHDASSPRSTRRLKRRRRVRAKISGTATRPRISVFRSNRGLSAQLIDDYRGTHARGRQLVRARAALARQSRARQARRRAARRARQGRRRHPRPCSTAAATATTVTSAPSPRRSARPASPSSPPRRTLPLPSPSCHVHIR